MFRDDSPYSTLSETGESPPCRTSTSPRASDRLVMDLAVELKGADKFIELDECEKLLQQLESGELHEQELDKMLEQSLLLHRQIKQMYSSRRNIERMLYESMLLYNPKEAPQEKHREELQQATEESIRRKMRIKDTEIVERAMHKEDVEIYKKELQRKEDLHPRYISGPKEIRKLQLRPFWNNRFSRCERDFNEPAYDLSWNLLRWYFDGTGLERKNKCQPWQSSHRPLFDPDKFSRL